MEKLVSVGMPTYNRPNLLALALGDIVNQDYRNIEIIISDNCSAGSNTEAVVRRFMESDSRIKYIRQPIPITATDNFKYVLAQSTGKFFMWASDDDRWESNYISEMLNVIDSNKDCVLAYSEPYLITLNGDKNSTLLSSNIDTRGLSKVASLRNVLRNQNLNNETCGIYKRSALANYDFPKFYGADHMLLAYIALKGAICKGKSGLFSLRLGGAGSEATSILMSFGIKPNIFNSYFGYVSQGWGLLKTLFKSNELKIWEKFLCPFLIIERLAFTKAYRQAIFSDVKRLIIKVMNVSMARWKKYRDCFYTIADYLWVFYRFRRYVKNTSCKNRTIRSIALVSLEGMNYFMPTIWGMLSVGLKSYGYKIYALTLRSANLNNRYYRIFGVHLVYLEDFIEEARRIFKVEIIELEATLQSMDHFNTYHSFIYNNLPLGKSGLSTYARTKMVGEVDISDIKVKDSLDKIIVETYLSFLAGCKFVESFNIEKAFFTELNTDSYSGIYRACLNRQVDIVRWASSNKDNSYFIQHLNVDYHSVHHSSLSPYTWLKIKDRPFPEELDKQLEDFFTKRYKGEWKIFSRNFKNTEMYEPGKVRGMIGLDADDTVAIIYSHILYDTQYFYGWDLFDSYAEWLIETIRAACENTKIKWFIKLHPSNIWRGEKSAGNYEEEVLIRKAIGQLPSHVKIIPPDTLISPLSWMHVADIGVTCRGTAGIEMACLGKPVLTAGYGRYEGAGFTIDSLNRQEYLQRILNLPLRISITEEQKVMARKYTHALFIGKCFDLFCIDAAVGTGKKEVRHYNDMLFFPSDRVKAVNPADWPDVKALAEWLENESASDYFRWESIGMCIPN